MRTDFDTLFGPTALGPVTETQENTDERNLTMYQMRQYHGPCLNHVSNRYACPICPLGPIPKVPDSGKSVHQVHKSQVRIIVVGASKWNRNVHDDHIYDRSYD